MPSDEEFYTDFTQFSLHNSICYTLENMHVLALHTVQTNDEPSHFLMYDLHVYSKLMIWPVVQFACIVTELCICMLELM